MSTPIPPHRQVADHFMAVRAYGDVEPTAVEEVAGEHVWYFEYALDEGVLSLEVEWKEGEGWSASVWDFTRR